ncbi:MAG: alpha-galactosidase [Phocaeicola sp.]|uniref:alpha-galactosidase n=1 Tax=Phocaeicola TaxID=909656 RepID=UPI00234E5D92|nr:alpha-galactosidase [Phocaeicola oris]MCE2617629.1 alpha-galactosidase [Phocaeicola oris]
MRKALLIFLYFLNASFYSFASQQPMIKVMTEGSEIVLQVGEDGRLYQSYLGKRLTHDSDLLNLPLGTEAYLTGGMEDYFEPAVHVAHNDGNPSLLLKYVTHSTNAVDGGNETVITLKDDVYPVTVKLHYIAYQKEDVIKCYTEISHQEKKPITLYQYASSMLHVNRAKYFLTQFNGDWAKEVRMTEQELSYGKKIIDTKLGARADMICSPFFEIALDRKAEENNGEVLLGTLGWTGNFRFTFEVDNNNELRIISGINPYASEYPLNPNEIFRTPDFYFTYSANGVGQASRNFHAWALKYQVKDGDKLRMTLLNNWEATGFDFDEEKLISLMDDAVKLGVDMFLLDDGWFGNKYPRKNDRAGLGDWDETKTKLPNGIGRLTQAAKEKGVKFGLWIEPEMVNPKSELYEKHPDWVIHFPNREEYYFRNQLVLDLSNPKVQDLVYNTVDNLMTKYPDIAFFKWDCNSPITNIYSNYEKNQQSRLYIDYVHGLYNVLERIKTKYSELPMMLCSGGGGRTDYEALKYFTEFWASDNTDPIERLFIQWGFSHIFPAKTICAHVTSWNKSTGVKFRTDVASMCKLGFDIKLSEMNENEIKYAQEAVQNYNRLKSVIWDGELYRLVSPYESNHTSSMYVAPDKNKAVVFSFDIHPRYGEFITPVRLQGLDPNKMYRVKEINKMPMKLPNRFLSKPENEEALTEIPPEILKMFTGFPEKVYSGEYLMTVGLDLFTTKQLNSMVLEVTAE